MKKSTLLLIPMALFLASCGSVNGPQPGPLGSSITADKAISILDGIIDVKSSAGYKLPDTASFLISNSVLGVSNDVTYRSSSTGSGAFSNTTKAICYSLSGTTSYEFKSTTTKYATSSTDYKFVDGTNFYDACDMLVSGRPESKFYTTSESETSWVDAQTVLGLPTASEVRAIVRAFQGGSTVYTKLEAFSTGDVGDITIYYTYGTRSTKNFVQFKNNEVNYCVGFTVLANKLTVTSTLSLNYGDSISEVIKPDLNDGTWLDTSEGGI